MGTKQQTDRNIYSHEFNFPLQMTNNAPRISFASLNTNNLGTVRKLNAVLFPIKYSEKFYRDILQPDVEEFCRLSKCPDWWRQASY